MNLPRLKDLDVAGKKALVRLDLDTNPDPTDLRIKSSEETLNYLREKNCQITIVGHKGRPKGKIDESLSLKPFQPIFGKWGAKVEENLRFDPREEVDDENFAKKLANLGDIYINEAFATSHRAHASIIGIPKILPHAAGFRFVKEIENLSKVIKNPARPVVVIISGIKEDKVQMAKDLISIADKVLVGGKLPLLMQNYNSKLKIADLTPDKLDISSESIEIFEQEIKKAGTIVLAGVLGKYEDPGHRQGTKEIFEAVAKSSAYKVAGGGDTEAAISLLAIRDKFDWISVGGGAMLEFLINKTLPGIEALLH